MIDRIQNPLRIVKLFASNVKMLKVAAVTPSGAVVRITGPNGSGKSSLIDSIMYALGGAKLHPDQLIRNGEEKLVIKLDLGEIVATRTAYVDPDGLTVTDLMLEAKSGAVFKKPQHVLDAIIGELGWDVVAFLRMTGRTQMETLRKVVHLDVDLDAIDGRIQRDMEERKLLRPRIPVLDGKVVEAFQHVDPEMETATVDTSKLLDELHAAAEHNAVLGSERTLRAETAETIAEMRQGAHQMLLQAEQLESQARVLREQSHAKQVEANKREIELEARPALAGPVNDTLIRQELAAAEGERVRRQAQIDARRRHAEAIQNRDDAVGREAALSENIESLRREKREAIARANMPIAGLSFGENGVVTFNDIPLEQASQAEQIRVAMAIGMAMNPNLRILLIRDGSLLDSKSLTLVEQLAEENDYQVWIEEVSDGVGTVGVSMRAGEIVAIDGQPVRAIEPGLALVDG